MKARTKLSSIQSTIRYTQVNRFALNASIFIQARQEQLLTYTMSEKTEKQIEENSPIVMKLTWRNFILLPTIFGTMFAGILNGMMLSEWTQSRLREEHIPNNTESFSGCGQEQLNSSDDMLKRYETVQQQTAQWQMIFSMADNIPTAFTSLILPTYTDSYGRRFLLVLSSTGMCFRTVIVCFVIYFKASFWYIFAANIINSLTGSGFGLLSAGFSMVSDVTHTPKHRTIGIVVTESAIMCSVVLSSFFSGYFAETLGLGFFYTTIIGAGLSLLAFVLSLFIPETLPKQNRVKAQPVIKTLKRVSDFYVSSDFKGKRKVYGLLLAAFGFATINGINRGNMETLYFLGHPFCWGPSKIGTFSMVRTASQTFIGLGSVKFLQRCLSDESIGIISTMSNAASYIVEAFATNMLTIYMVPAVALFSFLIIPMIRTLMSSMTPVEKQGAMYASITSLEVVCTLIASLTQNAVYSLTISFMNGFVFIMLAVLSVINMLLMVAVKCVKPSDSNVDKTDMEVVKSKENGSILSEKL